MFLIVCKGLLAEFRPASVPGDRRIVDISVAHLLAHTAGWDHRATGARDPVFVGELRSASPHGDDPRRTAAASKTNIVTYMMNQTLQHQPGKFC